MAGTAQTSAWAQATWLAANQLRRATREPSAEPSHKAFEVVPSILEAVGDTLHFVAEMLAEHDMVSKLSQYAHRHDPYELSWELHRAGTMVLQAAGVVSIAHGRTLPPSADLGHRPPALPSGPSL